MRARDRAPISRHDAFTQPARRVRAPKPPVHGLPPSNSLRCRRLRRRTAARDELTTDLPHEHHELPVIARTTWTLVRAQRPGHFIPLSSCCRPATTRRSFTGRTELANILPHLTLDEPSSPCTPAAPLATWNQSSTLGPLAADLLAAIPSKMLHWPSETLFGPAGTKTTSCRLRLAPLATPVGRDRRPRQPTSTFTGTTPRLHMLTPHDLPPLKGR